MADFIETLNTNFNYTGIDIYDRYLNGEFSGYTAKAQEGYVFYDPNEENFEYDPETNEPIPVIYYYTLARFPRNFNMANFSYIAVLRSTVDENYIFGGGDDDHETM